MNEINKYICKDVCGIIDDYLHGDDDYWTNQYNKCMIELLTFKPPTSKHYDDFIFFQIMG